MTHKSEDYKISAVKYCNPDFNGFTTNASHSP